jgi:tetratricopeptide (TPR) repeat protein
MGNVFGIQGEYEMKRGLDPSGAMARAIACFKEAAAINPNYANAWVNLGVANLALAKYQDQRGKDPAASLKEALGDFDKALAIRPDFAAAISGKAEALAMRGGKGKGKG